MRTLVIGLGNPLLGDDGVGWHVAEELAKLVGTSSRSPLRPTCVEVDFHAGGGLSLMERLVGYDRTIIIDAMNLGQAHTGNVTSLRLEELEDPFAGHLASTHETNLQTALELGRAMDVELPKDIFIVAIESPHVHDFSETLTPPVTEAVPLAVQKVLERLKD
jgi:hydrogenase maturation protease